MKKGSITIYLALILMVVFGVIGILTEGARIVAIYSVDKDACEMAGESVLANYASQVFDDYGVLLVWEREPAGDQLKGLIQDNIEMADLNLKSANFLKSELVEVTVDRTDYVTDGGAKQLLTQIKDYVKYALPANVTKNILNKYKNYKNNEEEKEESNVADITEDDSEKLVEIVENIDEVLSKIKDIKNLKEKTNSLKDKYGNSAVKLNKNQIKKLKKSYDSIEKILDGIGDNVDDLLESTDEYQTEKKKILKKQKVKKVKRDYVENNKRKLENIKDRIEKIKELNISDLTVKDSDANYCIDNLIKYLEYIISKVEGLGEKVVTKEDEKNNSLYEKAKSLINDGILSLVTDESTSISDKCISDENLPSKKYKKIDIGIKDQATMIAYSTYMFGNFIDEMEDSPIRYEMEYLIGGDSSDKSNLTEVVEKIVLIRNGIDAAYLITDKVKMGEINTVATSVAAFTGIPFLQPIAKAILIEAWSLAEAVSDVKILLKGNKIKTIKNKDNWRTSLEKLGSNDTSGDEKGFTYINYCQMLLMMTGKNKILYRIMDLIQINIKHRYNSEFLMSKCFVRIKYTVKFNVKGLFPSFSLIQTDDEESDDNYSFQIKCEKKY